MSWISDVKDELKTLEISKKILRKFGVMVGGIFLLIGFWIYYSSQNFVCLIFLFIGTMLLVSGLIFPTTLSLVYKVWMGLAFTLGWLMSRILLTILFYFVITPIGLLAKLVGKDFLDINYKLKRESYWIIRPENKKADYTKMY